jgi:hypothetical protein
LDVSVCSSIWKRLSVVLGCCWTCEEVDIDEFDDGEVTEEVAENELIFCVPGVVVVVDVPVLPGIDAGAGFPKA